jgi:glycosyltransferase involved in cell wall biosynthesis
MTGGRASERAVKLTVLFSTHNGASTLPQMLDAFERLDQPEGGWKMVAIDNGSDDGSGDLLEARASKLPLTVLHEPRPGKSAGLNAGRPAIEGDLVVLTDDDVTPTRDWLTSWRRLADERKDYDIFGGAIEPVWPEPPPAWILRNVPKGFFAWTDFEEGPAAPDHIWGPNMAVRRPVIDQFEFHDGIGPNGGDSYATGAETEFVMRAAKAGHRCWHAPRVRVGHLIEPGQLSEEWLLQRAYNHARGWRRLWALGEPVESAPPVRAGRRLRKILTRLVISIARGRVEERFNAMMQLRMLQGEWAEWRHQKRRC